MTGLWTDPTKWSTNPYYPVNGNPLGTTYDVTIDAPGSYLVTSILNNTTVNSLTLNSAGATLATNYTLSATIGINLLAG